MPQQMHTTISVTASDDESDDRSRFRFCQRHRKPSPIRAWVDLLCRLSCLLLRWWVLPLLLATALLYLEGSRQGFDEAGGQAMHNASETEPTSNLNRINQVMSLVGGIKQYIRRWRPRSLNFNQQVGERNPYQRGEHTGKP